MVSGFCPGLLVPVRQEPGYPGHPPQLLAGSTDSFISAVRHRAALWRTLKNAEYHI